MPQANLARQASTEKRTTTMHKKDGDLCRRDRENSIYVFERYCMLLGG